MQAREIFGPGWDGETAIKENATETDERWKRNDYTLEESSYYTMKESSSYILEKYNRRVTRKALTLSFLSISEAS